MKAPRRCSKCDVEESEEHPFAKDRRLCKPCNAERDREYRARNKEKVAASTKKRSARWQTVNKDKYNERQREWRKNNPEKSKEYDQRYYSKLKKNKEQDNE